MKTRYSTVALFALAAFSMVASPASAAGQVQTIMVGSPNSNYCFPFGCGSLVDVQYQQFYKSSSFGGPVLIRAISFDNTFTPQSFLTPGSFAIRLGVSAVTRANTTLSLDQNVRGVLQTFASLQLTNFFQPGDAFTINATTPFYYDPSLGDLIVEVDGSNMVASDAQFPGVYWVADESDQVTWSALVSPAGFDRVWKYGAVTSFETATVPEPSTGTLALFGLIALGAMPLRRIVSRRASRWNADA